MGAKDVTGVSKLDFRASSYREFFKYRGQEVILSGPAGTGKSFAALAKIFLFAQQYPRTQYLIVRKTRSSLVESTLKTLERDILGSGFPGVSDVSRQHRQKYTLPNGSEIVVGGMDKPEKVLSTEYAMIYVNEAIEVEEEDWETLITRIRSFSTPYGQIMGDTNPGSPSHWIMRRTKMRDENDLPLLKLIETRHKDNPYFFNQDTGLWTPEGESYVKTLFRNTTGTRRARLAEGRWVQSEGQVYEEYDPTIHVVKDQLVPNDWPRYLAIDLGFNNPTVVLWIAKDPDGRLHVYRQLYRTKMLTPELADKIRVYSEFEPDPSMIICDHEAQTRAQLTRYLGREIFLGQKEVERGIRTVKHALMPKGDGQPHILIYENSLVEMDHDLFAMKKPTCIQDEFLSYVWNPNRPEEPIKENDHALDALRYAVMRLYDRGTPITDGFEIKRPMKSLEERLKEAPATNKWTDTSFEIKRNTVSPVKRLFGGE